MADIKISELEPTTDLEGLYTIGSDKNNLSKKVSLQFLKDAANYANEQGDYAKEVGDTVNGNVGVNDYPAFSASASYSAGDIVRYNGTLYQFTANHAASAWNGNDVKATSINAITSGKLTELESEVGDRIEVYEDAVRLDEDDLYICDKKGNIVARIGANGIVAAGFGTSDMETIKNGKDDFKITDSQGNVILKLSANSSIDDIIRTYLEKRYIKPALSWIDDDFQIFVGDHGEGGEVVMPFYQGIHDWMIEKDIRMDFAYIPSSSEARMKLLHEWEEENFRFLLHPDHDGWYAQYGNVHDITKVRKGIVNCIRHFRQNNIMTDCKILVWPGSSDQFPDNVNVVKNYIDCGITAMGTSSNEGLKESRLKLQRLALSLSPTKTKTWMKNYIKECLERGDWVILYTHLYNESYVPTDVVDETTNSLANIKEIVEYANSICPMRSTEEIWNERKFIYDYVKL